MNELTAVGFDLGDTLCEYAGVPLNWEREYPLALAAVAEGCGLDPSEARLAAGSQLLARYNTRRSPRPDEREYSAAHIFGELLDDWGAPREALDRCILLFFKHFRQTLRAFADSAPALTELHRRGIATGVLSDVPYGMPNELVHSDLASTGLPVPEGLIVTSTDVGYRKPHPAGFAVLARRLGVACDRLVYVGNEQKDVAGGNAAGCRTVLLWRAATEPPSWGQALVIRSLDQLLNLPQLSSRA
jgi:phosphoglycolate phosphatase-like HAD superfamily hydrolase